MADDSLILVFVTVPSKDVGHNIALSLLEERLIACANLLPEIESHYRWEGKIQSSAELLLILKTRRGAFPALEAALLKLHPYSTPEIIAVDATAVEPRYLQWVQQETTPQAAKF